MKKVLISLALLALPAFASAQTFCEGRAFDGYSQLSIAWDSCWFPGSTAASFKSFNCLATPTNNTTNTMHFQFKSPIAITSSVAATGVVDVVQSPGSPLPNFYHYESSGCAGSGTVKGVALSVFAAPMACSDNGFVTYCDDGGGNNACAASGFGYSPDAPVMGVGRFIVIAVRGFGTPIDADANVWAWSMGFNNRLRNACAGCNQPASILWQSLGLESDDGQAPVCLTGPDSPKGPASGGLNGGGPIGPGDPTPVRNSTWGQIKALYR